MQHFELEEHEQVENINYEKILANIKTTLLTYIHKDYPDFNLSSESDPLLKTIEIAAYRELLVRQKIKNTIKMSLLSQSSGNALIELANLVLDKNQLPKSDSALKNDVNKFWNDTPFYTTGTKAAYKYFTQQAANGKIKDVNVVKKGNIINLYLLFNEDYQTLSNAEKNKIKVDIEKKIEDENIRRITDKINIDFAKLRLYTLKAELSLFENYSLEDLEEIIKHEVKVITHKLFYIAKSVRQDPLVKAFYQPGVKAVTLQLASLSETNLTNTLMANEDEALLWDGKIDFKNN